MHPTTCPKCQGRFDEGFLLDRRDHGNAELTWIEGRPERSFWSGLKLRGRGRHAVVTHRCERCGFLELYAPRRD